MNKCPRVSPWWVFHICLYVYPLPSWPIYPLISHIWSSYVIIYPKKQCPSSESADQAPAFTPTVPAVPLNVWTHSECGIRSHPSFASRPRIFFATSRLIRRPRAFSTISRRLSFSRSMAFSSSPSRLGVFTEREHANLFPASRTIDCINGI